MKGKKRRNFFVLKNIFCENKHYCDATTKVLKQSDTLFETLKEKNKTKDTFSSKYYVKYWILQNTNIISTILYLSYTFHRTVAFLFNCSHNNMTLSLKSVSIIYSF